MPWRRIPLYAGVFFVLRLPVHMGCLSHKAIHLCIVLCAPCVGLVCGSGGLSDPMNRVAPNRIVLFCTPIYPYPQLLEHVCYYQGGVADMFTVWGNRLGGPSSSP